MEPSKKSRGMEEFLEVFSGRSSAIRDDRCVNPPMGCGKQIKGFRDETSRREFTISGLCQKCQDEVFG